MCITLARQIALGKCQWRQMGVASLLGFPVLFGSAGTAHARKGNESPSVGKLAPSFSLMDVDGKERTLADFRGRPIAIFFFCGCPWCAQCAHEWAELQRHGEVAPTKKGKAHTAPTTLLVFSGDATSARSFAGTAGLATKQTTVLPDLTMRVTLSEYQAEPCPRVFVVDANGLVSFINNHAQDAPRKASGLAITAYALSALRRAGEAPIASDVSRLVKTP